MILEVCVDNIAGLDAALAGGADRIELCSALGLGGLTPSAGLMAEASKRKIACYAMIRPRVGGFVYQPDDIEIMVRDIDAARAAGLDGVVLGASLPDGRLDQACLEILCKRARGLGKTLHRAFDLVPDLGKAIDLAVGLGFERILTSGRAKTAVEGLDDLRTTTRIAEGRISIMPGSGIRADNVADLLDDLSVSEIHASCASPVQDPDPRMRQFGFVSDDEKRTDFHTVRALKQTIMQKSGSVS